MIRAICRSIWLTSETLGIPLGRIAPWIFGGMVGARPARTDDR
jgi:hypothetical protein